LGRRWLRLLSRGAALFTWQRDFIRFKIRRHLAPAPQQALQRGQHDKKEQKQQA
jgi:hypothetical protein